MRLQNKAIVTIVALSMALTSFVSVYAAPTATTTITNGTNTSSDSITIAAGDTITVKTTFDSLVGYSGYQYEVYSDATAFSAVEGDNTEYNFGTAKKPVYLPNYMLEELISSRMEETHATLLIDDFKYSFNNGVGRIMGTSSEGYEITAADEAADMYPDNALGINFVANSDIKAGTYQFKIHVEFTNAAGVATVLEDQIVNVVVEGSDPDPTPADPVGTEIATGVYYAGNVDTTTKTLTDNTTFSISYNGGEPKVIAQTLAQILGGEGIAGNLTGKLHFAIKPVSVEASSLDFSKFVINVN